MRRWRYSCIVITRAKDAKHSYTTPEFEKDVYEQLMPFNDFETTGDDSKYVQTIDVTDELWEMYNTTTRLMLRDEDGNLYWPRDKKILEKYKPTKEDKKLIKQDKGAWLKSTGCWEPPAYEQTKEKFYYRHTKPVTEVYLAEKDMCTFIEFVSDDGMYGDVVLDSIADLHITDDAESGKYGYTVKDPNHPSGYRVYKRTNENGRWVVASIGGMYAEPLIDKFDTYWDTLPKAFVCNLDSIEPNSFVIDGQWHDILDGDNRERWEKMLASLAPDDILTTVEYQISY